MSLLLPRCPACWTPWAEAFEPDIDTYVQCPTCDSTHVWSEWNLVPKPLGEDWALYQTNETKPDSDD
jgi:hypothetical protein